MLSPTQQNKAASASLIVPVTILETAIAGAKTNHANTRELAVRGWAAGQDGSEASDERRNAAKERRQEIPLQAMSSTSSQIPS